ncbi:MAG: hypothetical protein RR505_12580 [Raoultibacter sp.]
MIEITKKYDDFGDQMYEFSRIDEDGNSWELGRATMRKQDGALEDESFWFEGFFDTKAVFFHDDEELACWLKKWKSQDEVWFTEA